MNIDAHTEFETYIIPWSDKAGIIGAMEIDFTKENTVNINVVIDGQGPKLTQLNDTNGRMLTATVTSCLVTTMNKLGFPLNTDITICTVSGIRIPSHDYEFPNDGLLVQFPFERSAFEPTGERSFNNVCHVIENIFQLELDNILEAINQLLKPQATTLMS